MKKLLLFVVIALALAAAAGTAAAQRATRVHFARGTHSAVVTGYLSSYKSHRDFLIRVRSGQTMKIETIDGSVSTFLSGPPGSNYEQDMAADCHSYADVEKTDAGDYELSVVECQKADPWRGKFKVKITVR